MSLNIKNNETCRLADELARMIIDTSAVLAVLLGEPGAPGGVSARETIRQD